MTVSGENAPGAPLLELRNISKSFGSTRALHHVNLTVAPGTVHTILGENGSGKSTLVKVLSGVIRPDHGELLFQGEARSFRFPRDAQDLGIATVFQEVLVAPNRSVLENVLLGTDGLFSRNLRGKQRAETAKRYLEAVSHSAFDVRAECGSLDLMHQQQVTIARAFVTQPKLLILDESTAALDIRERGRLFEAIERHTEARGAVVFISHRLDEVMQLSDHVTVLRSGERIGTLERSELSEQRLLTLLNPDFDSAEGIAS